MEGGGKLTKLKEKLAGFSASIDDADCRKAECKFAKIDASSRLEKNKSEVESYKRRIALLESELKDVSGRVECQQCKLDEVADGTSELEHAQKDIEDKETEDDVRIQDLDEQTKDAKQAVEEKQNLLADIKRKIVGKRDYERTNAKAEALEEKMKMTGVTIEEAKSSLQELEEREGEHNEKEEASSSQICSLKVQLAEFEVRVEAGKRLVNVHQVNLEQIELDIVKKDQETEQLNIQMEEMNDATDTEDED